MMSGTRGGCVKCYYTPDRLSEWDSDKGKGSKKYKKNVSHHLWLVPKSSLCTTTALLPTMRDKIVHFLHKSDFETTSICSMLKLLKKLLSSYCFVY